LGTLYILSMHHVMVRYMYQHEAYCIIGPHTGPLVYMYMCRTLYL